MKGCSKCPLSCQIMGEPLELENTGPNLMVFEVPTKEENINGEYINIFTRELFEKYDVNIDVFSKTSLLKCHSSTFNKEYFNKCKLWLWKDILAVRPDKIYCWGSTVAGIMRKGAGLKKFTITKHFFTGEPVIIGEISTVLFYLPSLNTVITNRSLCEQTMEFLKNESKH